MAEGIAAAAVDGGRETSLFFPRVHVVTEYMPIEFRMYLSLRVHVPK